MVDAYALVATEQVENYISQYLSPRSVIWTMSADVPQMDHQWSATMLPWEWSQMLSMPTIELPRPATAVTSVTMGVWGQSPDTTLVLGTDYDVDLTSALPRLKWISNVYQNYQKDHLQVTFMSGMTTVPMPLKHAITILTTALYENRGDSLPDINASAIQNLIGSFRFVSFG